jgi:hypothetical protein
MSTPLLQPCSDCKRITRPQAKADDKGDKEAKASAGQSRNAGKLPPSGSEDEEEDEDSEDEESSDDAPEPAYLAQPAAPRKKWAGELGLLGTAAGCGADGGYWRSSGQWLQPSVTVLIDEVFVQQHHRHQCMHMHLWRWYCGARANST